MPGTVLYPNSAALHNIGLLRTDLAGGSLKLFKNDLVLSPSTVVGDFDEADFSGYTAKTITAGLPAYIDPFGGASFQVATEQFDHDGGATGNVVYGFWLTNAGGDLLIAGKFYAGIAMNALGDSIPLDVKFNFGN